MDAKTYYQILGVEEGATIEEIKRAYWQKCKQFHPDIHGDAIYFHEQICLINEAYEVLSDIELRIAYDRKLSEERGDGSSSSHEIKATSVKKHETSYYRESSFYNTTRECEDYEHYYENTFDKETYEQFIEDITAILSFYESLVRLSYDLTKLDELEQLIAHNIDLMGNNLDKDISIFHLHFQKYNKPLPKNRSRY